MLTVNIIQPRCYYCGGKMLPVENDEINFENYKGGEAHRCPDCLGTIRSIKPKGKIKQTKNRSIQPWCFFCGSNMLPDEPAGEDDQDQEEVFDPRKIRPEPITRWRLSPLERSNICTLLFTNP